MSSICSDLPHLVLGGDGNEISWSPDGKFLAYIEAAETLKLFLLSLDNLERTQIQPNCGHAATPTFSPRGTFLAWGCEDLEYRSSLMLLRMKDSRQTHLLSRPDEILGLAWSNDERRMLFSSQSVLWEISRARPDDLEILPIGHDASGPAARRLSPGLAYVQRSANTNIWRLDSLASFTLGKPTPQWIGGMPVSKDGKFMLYPQVDSASSDLMLIENWR